MKRKPRKESEEPVVNTMVAVSSDPAEQELAGLDLKWNVKFLAEKCMHFAQVLSGVTLYPYQVPFGLRVMESLLENDGEEITALFARQSGKTETIAVVCDGAMVILPLLATVFPEKLGHFKDGLWIGLFAPIGDQTATTYERIKLRLRNEMASEILADPEVNDGVGSRFGTLSTLKGSFVRAHSANKQTKIESKTYHLLIMEECQDIVDSIIRKSIHPMGASTNATIVKIGTANTRKSEFYNAIQRNKRREVKRAAKKNHFQFDYKIVQKYNPKYAAYIKKEKERLGVDSDEFRMAYGLEFILERGMFLSDERWDAMCEMGKKLGLVKETDGGFQAAGIDNGKTNDSTLVTVVDFDMDHGVTGADGRVHYTKTVLAWLELYGDDYESQFWQIVDFLAPFLGLKVLVIDATGVGDPIADRFLHYYEDTLTVVPYKYSTPSKSIMYKYFLQEILADRVIIPSSAKVQRTSEFKRCKQQCLDMEKRYSGQYMVCCHPDAKEAHDDYPDSMAMAVFGNMVEFMAELEESDNKFYSREPREHGKHSTLTERLFGKDKTRWRKGDEPENER